MAMDFSEDVNVSMETFYGYTQASVPAGPQLTRSA